MVTGVLLALRSPDKESPHVEPDIRARVWTMEGRKIPWLSFTSCRVVLAQHVLWCARTTLSGTLTQLSGSSSGTATTTRA
eukprot:scaffold651378_cov52-Prasinocladus_malaysianus.AAC.1